MSSMNFKLPDAELGIIWRYLDGVSQAVARRFEGGSSPGEDNLTFLLCELLDEGTTSLHLLEYPLVRAKEDLEKADGGITLDVSFQSHEHTGYVEHHFSGADLGLVFVVDHPYFGRSERGILLQAKRLFPTGAGKYSLSSSFRSFHSDQRAMLREIERRFSAHGSVFYLWYAPASGVFSEDDAKLIRSLEATASWDWHDLRGWHPFFDEMIEFGWPWFERRWGVNTVTLDDDERHQSWRRAQPGTRVSNLDVVEELTTGGGAPQLISLFQARANHRRRRRPWRWFAFEPLADLFLLGLLSDGVGRSSGDWLRLVRGEKIPMPAATSATDDSPQELELPEIAPTPRHSLTFTLRSSLHWPENLPRPE